MLFTKIIATVGPSCDSEKHLEQMIKAGVSVFRFNMKHNTQQWHSARMARVRKAAKKLGTPVAILMDLQGPEIRIGSFTDGQIKLDKDEQVIFALKPGLQKTIILNNLKLLCSLKTGQRIFLDDGRFEFEIVKAGRQSVAAKVVQGGILTDHKGVNIPELSLELPTLLEKDLQNISVAAKNDVDWLALSYVRSAKDIVNLKKAMKKQKLNARIIAKIESPRALENIDEIIASTDAVMIARGDLAIEISPERVPYFQKEIITACRLAGKPVITATQMLHSMIDNYRPTRAEVSDVANAVYDGSDALMLSAETASGQYPLMAVGIMAKTASFIETKREEEIIEREFVNQTDAIVDVACKLADDFNRFGKSISKFIVLTEGGHTARLLSSYRPKLPIIAVTQDKQVRDQLCLSYAVTPVYRRFPQGQIFSVGRILRRLKSKGYLKAGERVIVVYGKIWGKPGKTNTIKLETIN